MSNGEFPAIDGNALGELCGVYIDRATISYLLGSVKWLASEERYFGDIEDIYETTQAFEQLARRLMLATNESECVELVIIPSGTIAPYIGTGAPSGWLSCNGTEYNIVDYPDLAAVLPASLKNTVTGKFNTPDMQGRMPLGASTDDPLFELATTGGEHEHVLTVEELASHTHLQNAHTHPTHNHDYPVRLNATGFGSGAIALSNGSSSGPHGTSGTATPGATAVNQSTGANLAHNNMPPYFVTNYIIKT